MQDALREARRDALAQRCRLPSQHPWEGRPLAALFGVCEHALEEGPAHRELGREALGCGCLVHPSHHRAQAGQRCCITAEVPALDEGEKRPCHTIANSVSSTCLKHHRNCGGDSVPVDPDVTLYHGFDILEHALSLPYLEHQTRATGQADPVVRVVPAAGKTLYRLDARVAGEPDHPLRVFETHPDGHV